MNYRSDLPDTVENYFTWIESHVPERTVDSFGTDAFVVDNGHTYTGRDEILAWLTGAATEWETTSTRLSSTTSVDLVSVTTHVTGNFPGGQVDLHHEFALDSDGLIRALTITA